MPESSQRQGREKRVLALLALGIAAWFFIGREDAPAPPESAPSRPQTALAPPRAEAPQQPIAPEDMPAPFEGRMIRKPEPGAPQPSQTASLCSDENGNRMKALVSRSSGRQFAVDSAAWRLSLASTRAGIASWASLCEGDGGAIDIVASGSGLLLATYDTQSGLREH